VTDQPTVSGNPVIRIGEEERPVAFRNHHLDVIQPGESVDLTIHVTSHDVVTHLLAVALQELEDENATYIGISSTNVAIIDPLVVKYESWITSVHSPEERPLDDSPPMRQIDTAFDLDMVGDLAIEVIGIKYHHHNMVGFTVFERSNQPVYV
jgi:hypothetical protein